MYSVELLKINNNGSICLATVDTWEDAILAYEWYKLIDPYLCNDDSLRIWEVDSKVSSDPTCQDSDVSVSKNLIEGDQNGKV